jgi:hypothetical protein
VTTKRAKVSDGSQLFIRTSPDDEERLSAMLKRLPMMAKSTIAREAMRLGLTQIEANPAVILGPVQSH